MSTHFRRIKYCTIECYIYERKLLEDYFLQSMLAEIHVCQINLKTNSFFFVKLILNNCNFFIG